MNIESDENLKQDKAPKERQKALFHDVDNKKINEFLAGRKSGIHDLKTEGRPERPRDELQKNNSKLTK